MDFFDFGFQFERLGRFWNRNTEIDILGYTTDGRTVVGEIKWTRSPVDTGTVQALLAKQQWIQPYIKGPIEWVFISRAGFKRGVQQQYPHVKMVDLRAFKITN